jgi:hypothetical protein
MLEREPVAIFEVQAASGLGLGHYLAEVLKKGAPNVRAISPQETATRINTQGLASDYGRMRTDSEHSNILEAALLRKIGTAIGVRYVFQPRLAAFTQTMTERWKFADIRLVQTRSSILRLALQLWDTQTGELVWTSVAEAILASEGASQDPVFFEDAAKIALGSVIADLLRGKTTSTYTPLTDFLNQLIQKPEPEEKSK